MTHSPFTFYILAFCYLFTDFHSYIILLFKIIFQSAILCISGNGLKVTVEESKCVQANAFIQESIFQSYELHIDSITLKINLDVLLVS